MFLCWPVNSYNIDTTWSTPICNKKLVNGFALIPRWGLNKSGGHGPTAKIPP